MNKCYNIFFCDANGTRADRPNGGCYVTDAVTSQALTCRGIGNETAIVSVDTVQPEIMVLNDQGGGVMQIEKEECSPTLRREMKHHEPIVCGADLYNGKVTGNTAVSLTANSCVSTTHTGPTVVYGIDQYNGAVTGDASATLGVNCGYTTGRNGVLVRGVNLSSFTVQDDFAVAITGGDGQAGHSGPSVLQTNGYADAAGFIGANGAKTRGIGYEENVSPTVPANQMLNVVSCQQIVPPVPPTLECNLFNKLTFQDNNKYVIMQQTADIIKERAGKPGGEKGALVSHELSLTIATSNNQTLIARPECETIVFDGDKIAKKERKGGSGLGVCKSDVCYTQTVKDVHAVFCYNAASADFAVLDMMGGKAGCHFSMENISPTLATTHGDSHAIAYGINCNASLMYPCSAEQAQTLSVTHQGGVLDVCPTLTAANNPSRSPQSSEVTSQVAAICKSTAQVRRLTPLECERLMGFPDGHTMIPWKGKPAEECPDAPRYKACGNSMCVNVMRWIGTRIQKAIEEKSK